MKKSGARAAALMRVFRKKFAKLLKKTSVKEIIELRDSCRR